MNKIDIFDEAGFAEFLLSNTIVKQGTEKFFLHWVRMFHTLRNQWPGYAWYDQLAPFLENLQRSESITDWQMRQADQAVRLYFTSFLRNQNMEQKPPPLLQADNDGKFSLQSALNASLEVLRLKNYARQTEKTYLHWTKDFLLYTGKHTKGKDSFELANCKMTVRNYLA